MTVFRLLTTKEQQLSVAEEPGLLAAVGPFLRGGDKAGIAINLLFELGRREGGEFTVTARKCVAAIFDSSCFSSVKDMAETGITVVLLRKAWEVIWRVSRMEEERKKAMLDSAGMVALLLAGLKSEDDCIAERASVTTRNLSCSAEVASDLLDSHPDLVKALVLLISTSGVGMRFMRKSQLTLSLSHSYSLVSILIHPPSF